MKSDVEKTIDARVAAAFADTLPPGHEMMNRAQELVRAVWIGKIYAALPKDIPEYFLDAELEQFLKKLSKNAMRESAR